MNARELGHFFKNTAVGSYLLFGIGVVIFGALVYGYRTYSAHQADAPPPPKPLAQTSNQPVTFHSGIPSLDLRNAPPPNANPATGTTSEPVPPRQRPLPLSLYNDDSPDTAPSDNYAPYGRLIPCETIITIDSAKIETPIVGFVTEDLYHNGRLIIPAGAEVHGKAQTDRSRERIASDTQWYIVWRTTDRMNGAELSLKGIALDMECNYAKGTWALTDGSAGLRGDVIKSDNMAEIKLFAATFLSALASGLQDTQDNINPWTGGMVQSTLDSPKNAALQATSSVINEYARQISDAIKRDGFYVRVPAGKQFYLYVTQTIDLDEAQKGQSKVKEINSKERVPRK